MLIFIAIVIPFCDRVDFGVPFALRTAEDFRIWDGQNSPLLLFPPFRPLSFRSSILSFIFLILVKFVAEISTSSSESK